VYLKVEKPKTVVEKDEMWLTACKQSAAGAQTGSKEIQIEEACP
jgi:hypothetical protein